MADVPPKISEAAKEAGFFSRNFGKDSAMRTTFRESSTKMKFVRGAGITAGVVLFTAGLKEAGRMVGVVSPNLDEDGKALPTGFNNLCKSVAEVGAGAALICASLFKGGKGAGQSI